jgi:hypothetical protein
VNTNISTTSQTYICRITSKRVTPEIRNVQVIRYVTPLREGGSLPAIAEADDGFLYVLKFRGAGQGTKALIADFIGGEIARAAGFNVPEIVFATLDAAFGRSEPDEEIQDLLRASTGINLALHYLSGSITFDPAVTKLDSPLASRIVWLDALLTNVDRTARNTNMLSWNKKIWLIDHGAALYFHHSWDNWEKQSLNPFPAIKDHVLLPWANEIEKAGEELKQKITSETIRTIIEKIPDDWLMPQRGTEGFQTIDSLSDLGDSLRTSDFRLLTETREVYIRFLENRIAHSSLFVKRANDARQSRI